MVLEFADGTAYEGISFGAPGKSISGECVFQTGEFFARFVCKFPFGWPRWFLRVRLGDPMLTSGLEFIKAWLGTQNL